MQVEARKQLPNETGADYAISKRTLYMKKPSPVVSREMINSLIRGLLNPEHRSAMIQDVPDTLQEFIKEIERQKSITNPPMKIDDIAALLPTLGITTTPTNAVVAPPPVAAPSQMMAQIQALQEENRRLRQQQTQQRNAGNQPAATWPRPPPTTVTPPTNTNPTVTDSSAAANFPPSGWRYRPPTPPPQRANPTPMYTPGIDNRICHRCDIQGHIGRNCPTFPGPYNPAGNGQAGPTGQPGQQY